MTAEEIEFLIATSGRKCVLPAGTHFLGRPLLVTNDDFTIDGSNAILGTSAHHDAVIVTPLESLLIAPAGHCPVDVATGRLSFRTFGEGAVVFRNTPLDRGPAPGGWQTVRRLQVDLRVVRHHSEWTGKNFPIVGMCGPQDERPAPWMVQMHPDGLVRLGWRDAQGATRSLDVPIAGNPTELWLHFRLDLDVGTIEGQCNTETASTTFPTGLQFDPDHSSAGVLGVMGASGMPKSSDWDLEYCGFRVHTDWLPIPTLPSDFFNGGPTGCLFLLLGEADGHFVRWWGGQSGWGLMQDAADPSEAWRTVGVTLDGLDVRLPGGKSYGTGILALPSNDLVVRNARCEGGAMGVHVARAWTNSYPFRLEGIRTRYTSGPGVVVENGIGVVRDLTVGYPQGSAFRANRCNIRLDHAYCGPSNSGPDGYCDDVWWFDGCDQAFVRDAQSNHEGRGPGDFRRGSYFRFRPADAGVTAVSLTNCSAEHWVGPHGTAVGVRLDAGPDIPSESLNPFCRVVDSLRGYGGHYMTIDGDWGVA